MRPCKSEASRISAYKPLFSVCELARARAAAVADSRICNDSSEKSAIHFGRQKEIRLRKAVYFVRPNFHAAAAPTDVEVGVVRLLFRDLADAIRECQCLREISKLECP